MCSSTCASNVRGGIGVADARTRRRETDTRLRPGGFAELPDDAVVKIPPSDRQALIDALQRLVTDDELRRETSARALAAAQERGSKRYAREFLAFAEEVRRWAPALELCDHVTDELGEMGVSASLPKVDRIARETSLILANEPPRPINAMLLREIEPRDAGPDTVLHPQ